jgi:hypothetical protein
MLKNHQINTGEGRKGTYIAAMLVKDIKGVVTFLYRTFSLNLPPSRRTKAWVS